MSRYAATKNLTKTEWREIKKRLGSRLNDLRIQSGFTHAKVAKALGANIGTSIRWHTGAHPPSVHDLCALAKLYGRNVQELVA